MSVCMMIANPINEQEEQFYLPIAGETTFQKDWLPVIERLPVKWANWFECGVEIGKADFAQVLDELQIIKQAIPNTMEQTRKQQMQQRLEKLYQAILTLQKNGRWDINIWIG